MAIATPTRIEVPTQTPSEFDAFADAILRGTLFSKKAVGTFVRSTGSGVRACAIGAAFLDHWGAHAPSADAQYHAFRHCEDMFPVLEYQLTDAEYRAITGRKTLPKWDYERTLQGVIYRLNDKQHWSRERIAAWVRTLGKEATA